MSIIWEEASGRPRRQWVNNIQSDVREEGVEGTWTGNKAKIGHE